MTLGVLPIDDPRQLYLDLLKRSLLGSTFREQDVLVSYLTKCLRGEAVFEEACLSDVRQRLQNELAILTEQAEAGFPVGSDLQRLPYCYTMIGRKRLDHIEYCVRTLTEEAIPGDLMECGVWRGGAVVFMRGLLAAFGSTDRLVWVADSFQGLPVPTAEPDVTPRLDLSRGKFPRLAVSLETVKAAFSSHGLLDDRVRFLEGWFAETLPKAPVGELALLRADGDLYSSTTEVLESLYDRVVPGGFVVVDDYFLPGCRQAVDEFLANRGVRQPIEPIDWTGVFWRKTR